MNLRLRHTHQLSTDSLPTEHIMSTASSAPHATWHRPHRAGLRRVWGLALTLAVLVTAGLAVGPGSRAAHAQVSPALIAPGFPALTLTYTDAQGPGTVTLSPQGPDPASGGTALAVTLTQNGYRYTGRGFARLGEQGGYVLDLTVTGAYGDSYHLSGTLIHDQDGVRWRGQGRWWATWNRTVTGEWQLAGGLFAQPAPQLSTMVALEPTTKAPVRGTVTLTALPEGETRFELELHGLLPGKAYSLQLHAGTPVQPSASFTQVTTVNADAWRRATASGLVRFRGTEDIALLDIADGNHVLSVVGFGQTVAVGSIAALQPLG
jgi:hypothetical protein